MYMLGRFLTASKPSRTWIFSASYVLSSTRFQPLRARLFERISLRASHPVFGAFFGL
jgi:hypothetical protein